MVERKPRQVRGRETLELEAEPRGAFAGIVLRVLLGEAPDLEIAGRGYRLSLERVFRLEEIDGGFVYFLRNAGALQRRVRKLEFRTTGQAGEAAGQVACRPPDS